MTRLNVVLLVALVFSALYLVRVQYESRRLYTEIERAQNEARKLEVEQERLQVEKRAHATAARVERLARELPEEVARLLSFRTELGDFYEAALAADPSHPRQLANWTVNDLIGALGDRDPADTSLEPADFARLVGMVADKQASASAVRAALPGLLENGSIEEVIAGSTVAGEDELGEIVERAIADNPDAVEKIKAGKHQAIGAVVGAVMRETKGRADGGEVQRLIRERLGVS